MQRTSGADKTDCFVCGKHKGEIAVPGGAIYQDELLFVGTPLERLAAQAPTSAT